MPRTILFDDHQRSTFMLKRKSIVANPDTASTTLPLPLKRLRSNVEVKIELVESNVNVAYSKPDADELQGNQCPFSLRVTGMKKEEEKVDVCALAESCTIPRRPRRLVHVVIPYHPLRNWSRHTQENNNAEPEPLDLSGDASEPIGRLSMQVVRPFDNKADIDEMDVVSGTNVMHIESDTEDAEKVLKRLENPKVKKIKNDISLPAESIRARLQIAGIDLYEPHPPLDASKDTLFSREFLSQTYGGSSQKTYPAISQSNLDTHGFDDWALLNLEMNPYAPQIVGAPGLKFNAQIAGRPPTQRGKEYRLFARIESNEWGYMGQFAMLDALPLTLEEWRSQPKKVHNKWAKKISEQKWGRTMRVYIHERRRLGRVPTPQELDTAVENNGEDYKGSVSHRDVIRALHDGWLMIHVSAMKCVGYEGNFLEDLVSKAATWTRTPKAKHPKARKTSALRHRQEKDKREEETEEEEEEEEEEEVEYRSRGTRRRPIVLV